MSRADSFVPFSHRLVPSSFHPPPPPAPQAMQGDARGLEVARSAQKGLAAHLSKDLKTLNDSRQTSQKALGCCRTILVRTTQGTVITCLQRSLEIIRYSTEQNPNILCTSYMVKERRTGIKKGAADARLRASLQYY